MNCDKTVQHLYIYLDGEATLVRRWRMRWHLRRCPPCEDGLVFEQRLKAKIGEGCREAVPPELVDRLRAFLQEHAEDGK